MIPYKLIVAANFAVEGREAEAICRAIGIDPVDNSLQFDFRAETIVPDDRVDDVIGPNQLDRTVSLTRRDVGVLRPEDYVCEAKPWGQLRIRAAIPKAESPARLLEIFDAVARPRAVRAGSLAGVADRISELFAIYRQTFDGGDKAVAYQVVADLVEHLKPLGGDVRATLEEAIEDVESGVFSDGVVS